MTRALHDRAPILIVGSTGAFGRRIATLLARDGACTLLLAGRTAETLAAQAEALAAASGRTVRPVVLDARTATTDDLARTGAAIVLNATGPFQSGDMRLAQAAIAAGCHYIDLADDRAFVVGFDALDAQARARGVLAVSGASSVPGISSAVVLAYRDRFAALEEIDIAISPGNAFDPGLATVASVLGGVGQPLRMLCGGAWTKVYGWQGLRRGGFGDAGRRWLGFVDVPDLALFPTHVSGLRTVRFQAGLEVSPFHLGLWAASWLVRSGAVTSLVPLASRLLAVKRRFHRLGSDRGGMTVTLRGLGHDGQPKALTWMLVARDGHGPFVPALAAVALARRLSAGREDRRGAMACFGTVSLADILAEARHLDIRCSTHEKPLPP